MPKSQYMWKVHIISTFFSESIRYIAGMVSGKALKSAIINHNSLMELIEYRKQINGLRNTWTEVSLYLFSLGVQSH